MRIVYSDAVWAALKKKYETTPGIEWTELVNIVSVELNTATPSASVVRRRGKAENWVCPINKNARMAAKTSTAKLRRDIEAEKRKLRKTKKLEDKNTVILTEQVKNAADTIISVSNDVNDTEMTLPKQSKSSFDLEIKNVVLTHRKNNRDMCKIHAMGKDIVLSAAQDYLMLCASAGVVVDSLDLDGSTPPDLDEGVLDQIKRRMNMGNALISLSKTGFESIKMALDIDKELYGLTPDAFIDRTELEAATKAKLSAMDEMLEHQKQKMLTQQMQAFQRDLEAMEQEALMPSLTQIHGDNYSNDDDDESEE